MWHLRVVVAGAVVAALAVAGCGSSSSKSGTNSSNSSGKPANIAYITYTYADYQQAEQAGLKAAVTPGGGSVTLFNANLDPQALQNQCVDAVSSGRYNAIVLAPVTPPTGVPCVTAAKAKGIPVVTMEFPVGKDPNDLASAQVPGVVGTVATTDSQPAADAAKLTAQACMGHNPCNVVVDTIPGDPLGNAILQAVSALPGVRIVERMNTNYDPASMHSMAPNVLAAHPNTNVMLTFDDDVALAALPAIDAAGLSGKVKLISAGGSRQAVKAIESGTLFATEGTWPYTTGKIAGQMAVKAVNGEPIKPFGVNGQEIGKPELVTKANVREFHSQWGPA